MDTNSVAAAWTNAFGAVAPVGFACRERLRDRWLRIHSLPQSKRYPESASEYAELLRRHNEVATTTLGLTACTLFIGQIGSSRGVPDIASLPTLASGKWVGVAELSMPLDQDVDDEWVRIAAAPVTWERGNFDDLIRAVAEEKVGHILFANLDLAQAYAPYDGGADLIFRSSADVDAMGKRWAGWLSSRRDGL